MPFSIFRAMAFDNGWLRRLGAYASRYCEAGHGDGKPILMTSAIAAVIAEAGCRVTAVNDLSNGGENGQHPEPRLRGGGKPSALCKDSAVQRAARQRG
jgi:hypothetical protein